VTATSSGGGANNSTGSGSATSPGSTTSSTPLALTGTQLRAFWFGVTSLVTGLLLLGVSRRRKTRFGR
jgi:hypothetical protein